MELGDTVRSVLKEKGHEIWSVTPEALVYDAIEVMADKRVGALLVISNSKLIGVVSERDYARKVILQGKSSKQTRVEEIMTSPVLFVAPQDTVEDSMRIMTNSRIRHLPIVENDRVLGVVSIGDLMKWIISAQEETIHQLVGGRMRLPDTIRSVLKEKGHEIWSVTPEALVYDAIEVMADKRVGALLVISNSKLIGVVSERDYARKVILQGKSSKQTRVEEIMTSPVLFVAPQDTVEDSMRIMTNSRIRHLPIVENERVLGVVSIGDLVKWIISAQEETIHYLNAYVGGGYPG